jgi:hypothetical protein
MLLERAKKALQVLERVEEALKALERVEKMTPEQIDALTKNSKISYPSQLYALLYQPKKRLYIYGMQLPHQFDREKLFESMLYLLSNKKIYNFVDLHDCAGGTNRIHENIGEGIGCNPYDRKVESDMWNKAVTSLISQNSSETDENEKDKKELYEKYAHFYGISEYVDMTAGSPAAWESISKIKDIRHPENSVVVHCLGGAGRTGSVILYLLLRDTFPDDDIRRRLVQPHFGYESIEEFIKVCRSMLDNKDGLEDINYMKNEIFGVSKIAYAIRFRQRLNRIFFFLAKHFEVTEFYTYGIPTNEVNELPKDEFAKHELRDIDWGKWESFDKESIVEWFN